MIIGQVMIQSSQEALRPRMGPAKDKHRFRESVAKVKIYFAKNGSFRMNEFRSRTNSMYLYICEYKGPDTYSP